MVGIKEMNEVHATPTQSEIGEQQVSSSEKQVRNENASLSFAYLSCD